MTLKESGEMYLETILILEKNNGNVRSIDIANYMEFSKPSISRAIKRLKNENYINVDVSGLITLTDEGRKIAENIYEKHLFFTEILVKLGVDRKQAEKDACKIEHYISDSSFKAIKNHVEKML